MGPRCVGIAVDLVKHKAGGIVLLLEKIKSRDTGLFCACLRINASSGNERVDEFRFHLGMNDEDVHTSVV